MEKRLQKSNILVLWKIYNTEPEEMSLYVHWKNTESDTFKFDNVWLDNSKEELIFQITIDSKLSFDSHI